MRVEKGISAASIGKVSSELLNGASSIRQFRESPHRQSVNSMKHHQDTSSSNSKKRGQKPKSDSRQQMLSESSLIQGCCEGKRTAQRELYDAYAPRMYAIAMRYVKTTAEADDVLQEAFINIFKNIHKFERDCPIEFWIRKIVINQALKSGRSKYDKAFKEEVSDFNYQSEDIEFGIGSYDFEDLLGIIRQLPEGFRQVFNLYAIEGYKHREIAELLGITEGTSKSQYARARKQLQEILLKEDTSYEQLRK